MKKAILTFDLTEGQEELDTALNGWKYKGALFELDQKMRAVTKYSSSLIHHDKEASDEEIEVCEKIRELIREELGGLEI